ncbi:hypothetical protein RJ55_04842 [Drechmeria coniospora]|nr:hypothetical protein RJ55_04842 [Drechmeria coniospora]
MGQANGEEEEDKDKDKEEEEEEEEEQQLQEEQQQQEKQVRRRRRSESEAGNATEAFMIGSPADRWMVEAEYGRVEDGDDGRIDGMSSPPSVGTKDKEDQAGPPLGSVMWDKVEGVQAKTCRRGMRLSGTDTDEIEREAARASASRTCGEVLDGWGEEARRSGKGVGSRTGKCQRRPVNG